MTQLGLYLVTQAHMGPSHLSLIGEPYKYLLKGQGFLIIFFPIELSFTSTKKERGKVFSLSKPTIWNTKIMARVIE